MALPKPIRRCKSCKALYVYDALFKGTCPNCGAKQ